MEIQARRLAQSLDQQTLLCKRGNVEFEARLIE